MKEFVKTSLKDIKCITCKYQFSSGLLSPCNRCTSNPGYKDYYAVKQVYTGK